MFKLAIYSLIFFVSFETIGWSFLGHPSRFQRPFEDVRTDIQTDFNVEYKFTSDGFRDFDFSSEFCADESKRILILGDSAAFGQGLDTHETFSKKLNERFCVENLSMIGKDITYYIHSLSSAKFEKYKKVVLLLHQNDTSLSYAENWYSKIKGKLIYNLHSAAALKHLRKLVLRNFTVPQEPKTVEGKYNNPATVIDRDPRFLKHWYSNIEDNENWLKSFRTLVFESSKLGVVEIGIVPEPAKCSKPHAEFFKSLGAQFDETDVTSDLPRTVKNICEKENNCSYVDVFKEICKAANDKPIFFPTDFHMKENGQYILLTHFSGRQ